MKLNDLVKLIVDNPVKKLVTDMELEQTIGEEKLLCSDCSCEELLQPCEACPNYSAQKPYGSRDKENG